MEEFINFINNNWTWLITIGVGLLQIIILVLKKTKVIKVDTAVTTVLEALPSMIIEAEHNHPEVNSGREKWRDVIVNAVALYRKLTANDIPDDFIIKINTAIEAILSTPKKKEVI